MVLQNEMYIPPTLLEILQTFLCKFFFDHTNDRTNDRTNEHTNEHTTNDHLPAPLNRLLQLWSLTRTHQWHHHLFGPVNRPFYGPIVPPPSPVIQMWSRKLKINSIFIRTNSPKKLHSVGFTIEDLLQRETRRHALPGWMTLQGICSAGFASGMDDAPGDLWRGMSEGYGQGAGGGGRSSIPVAHYSP